ncbi:MAG: hypothetical protein N5P05_002687 [Chroococcopsis gigantea SAG 12.99]|jgi:hypothetical protein|nr:hypothetical protein [Chroococcopsis gigantea SAG 12.99]
MFRLTKYEAIERWWETIMSAYLLVTLQSNYFRLEWFPLKSTEFYLIFFKMRIPGFSLYPS